jgi:hypothetical protein
MTEPPGLHAVTSAADRSQALAAGLPAVFAGTTFDPADPVLAEVCGSSSRVVLRTGMLPLAMQREISWWVATCHANGERVINTSEWSQWAAVAAGVVQHCPGVRSFADLALAEWSAAWARAFHAAHKLKYLFGVGQKWTLADAKQVALETWRLLGY